MKASYRVISFLAVSLGTMLASATTADTTWKTELLQWRAHRAEELTAPDGWFSLAGLEWLQPGSNSFGSAADNRIRVKSGAGDHLGVIEVQGDQVQLAAPPQGFPSSLTVDGSPAHPGKIKTDGPNPTKLKTGTLTLFVIQRGDRFALRIKDTQAPTRLGFHGLNWYAPDPHYRMEARWTPYTPPHEESIPTIIGIPLKLPVPGVAEFTLDGHTVRLEPVIEVPGDTRLFFILRDTTSKTATYGAARFLYASFPTNGLDKPGSLVLDFNRLQNPPCAYTPYATCPLPPPQNKLTVALPVGEKRYSH